MVAGHPQVVKVRRERFIASSSCGVRRCWSWYTSRIDRMPFRRSLKGGSRYSIPVSGFAFGGDGTVVEGFNSKLDMFFLI